MNNISSLTLGLCLYYIIHEQWMDRQTWYYMSVRSTDIILWTFYCWRWGIKIGFSQPNKTSE